MALPAEPQTATERSFRPLAVRTPKTTRAAEYALSGGSVARLERELSELAVSGLPSFTRVRLFCSDVLAVASDEIRLACEGRDSLLFVLWLADRETEVGIFAAKGLAQELGETAYWAMEKGELDIRVLAGAVPYLNDEGLGIRLADGSKYFAVDFAHPESVALPNAGDLAGQKLIEIKHIEIYSLI